MSGLKRAAFVIACLVCMAAGPALAEEKVLINGIDANYPPFAYVDQSGKPGGFDVDAVDWIAAKMGFKVKHMPVDWDGIIPNLLAKKIDFICSGMTITAERAEANLQPGRNKIGLGPAEGGTLSGIEHHQCRKPTGL